MEIMVLYLTKLEQLPCYIQTLNTTKVKWFLINSAIKRERSQNQAKLINQKQAKLINQKQ